jgi:hypothetical protein
MMRFLTRALSEERETYVLSVARIAFGSLLALFTLKLGRELLHGPYFGDVFHVPLVPESWVPNRTVYTVLLALQLCGALLGAVGWWARPALGVAASLGLFVMACDRLQYHNNRYELLLLVLLLSFTPCDRALRLGKPEKPGAGPRWAAYAMGAQLSVVYLASSLGKLLDPAWRSGQVLGPRFEEARPILHGMRLDFVNDLLAIPGLAHAASVSAIAAELFLALGLWFPKTRVAALWLGVMFHIGIEAFARVELFSYTMLAGYLAFVTPELRERTLSWRGTTNDVAPPLFTICRRLDWLRRFDHRTAPSQAELLVTTDRNGTAHRGLAAFRELARALPLAFPAWLPLWIATRGWQKRT